MVSPSKIDHFLSNVLGIKDWALVTNQTSYGRKLELLKGLVKAHVFTVYFQNVTMSATPTDERRAPTLEDIIETGCNGKGGVCIELNYFFRLVLEYLGFDAFTVAGDVVQCTIRDNHVCTIVRLTQDELFLVDIGAASPNYEPIPLHKLPYQGMAGGYPYEYRLSPEGIYQRVQLKGSYTRGDFPEGKIEEIRYTFTLEPKTVEQFEPSMFEIFTNTQLTPFLTNAFLFRHFEETGFILVFDTTVVIGGRETREVFKYKTYQELIPVVQKYFPIINDSELKDAIKVWCTFKQIDE